mgnify:CR=1 FL=1
MPFRFESEMTEPAAQWLAERRAVIEAQRAAVEQALAEGTVLPNPYEVTAEIEHAEAVAGRVVGDGVGEGRADVAHLEPVDEQTVADLCAAFQRAVSDVLSARTKAALALFRSVGFGNERPHVCVSRNLTQHPEYASRRRDD